MKTIPRSIPMAAYTVLVVDDQPINVQLLKRKLEQADIRVIPAYGGQEALDAVRREKPDLILLDIMMPEMDGIEVCNRLQADEDTRSIPVIFVTVQSAKVVKLEGLGAGAVDYITKPIDLDETLARVQTHLRFVTVNREMIDLQRRLAEARRSATIGAVTQGIAHNLNNLLGVVIGYLDLVKAYSDKPDRVVANVQHAEDAVNRIVSIIKQLGVLAVKSRPPLEKGNLAQLLESGIQRFHTDYKLTAPVTIDNPLGNFVISTNAEVFESLLSRVLMNSWESYASQPNGSRPIWVHTELVDVPDEGKFVRISVKDTGRGVDPKLLDHVFEPFISSKRTVGVGMGLTIARQALRSLGGEMSIENLKPGGACAILLHPAPKSA